MALKRRFNQTAMVIGSTFKHAKISLLGMGSDFRGTPHAKD